MQVKEDFRKSKQSNVHHRTGRTFLPEDQAIGTDGISLFAQIRASRDFFSLLTRASTEEEIAELGSLFQEYFELCLAMAHGHFARAGTPGEGNETLGLDPFNVVLNRLSRFSGIDVRALWDDFKQLHPDHFEKQESRELNEHDWNRAVERRSRITHAAMCYILAWEHLRIVHGQTARALMQKAQLLVQLDLQEF